MKSLMWLVRAVLADAGTLCGTDTARDILRISQRVEHEGMSFLTITLSDFGRDFERSLDLGQIGPGMFLGFCKASNHSALPAFLQGLLGQVFDVSGKLLNEPSKEAIRCIRQICLMWKKIQLPCSEERSNESFTQFVKCDAEVPVSVTDYPADRLNIYRLVSELLWTSCLYGVSERIRNGDTVPRHGPGATAERISGNRKYAFCEWTTRLEEHFPFTSFGLASLTEVLEDADFFENLVFREPGDERPVRVIQVPKTLKSPRIIAIEPVCMQYVQQSILELVVPAIEDHEIVGGHLNFSDQHINRELARQGSKFGHLATLDLSEASDRVSCVLVDEMLSAPGLKFLKDGIMACRSTRADVPGSGIIDLNKFASMGSALCFPIESMVFMTICLGAILEELNLSPTWENLHKAIHHVHIYGDDIIVSVDKVPAVVDWLESFRMKVNANKSFWTGKFRESCGMDAYDGYCVTPTYLRRMPPDNRRSTSEIASLIAFANHCYFAMFWQTAKAARERVEALIGPLPHVLEGSPGLGWHSSLFGGYYTFEKICPDLQKPLTRTFGIKVDQDDDNLTGYPALLKHFLKRGNSPTNDSKHLEKSVLSGRATLNRRWYPTH